MADLATLRRRRAEAGLGLEAAERRHRGVAKARAAFNRATLALLRAELNHRTAAPLLRARAARRPKADLFNQLGA